MSADAILGVAGTLLGVIVGSGASIWSASRAAVAARKARLRDQRSEVYVDAIASIEYRRLKRSVEIRQVPLSASAQQQVSAYLASYNQPEPHVLDARLIAFASAEVHSLMQRSTKAELDMRASYEVFKNAAPGSAEHSGARAAVRHKRLLAETADKAAIERIRFELQGSGPSLGEIEIIPDDRF